MSITVAVPRALAVALLAALVAVTVPARPDGPAAAAPVGGGTDPAARIAALGALARERSDGLATLRARRDETRRRLDDARSRAEAARARTDELSIRAAEAKDRFEAAQQRVGEVAAAAYRGGPSAGALIQLFAADSAADLAYAQELMSRAGERQREVVRQAKRERAAAETAAQEARDERNRLVALTETLTRQLPALETEISAAEVRVARVQVWLERWQAISGGTATPILGSPVLTAQDLSDWFTGTRRRARITVPIEELTRAFVDEGAAARVRGDIAFAQSILETGSFWFPDGGQVLPTDNNFAGIGACDSCVNGRRYADARTGVRAQMQLLRVYADPGLTNAQLNPPAVDPRLDTHFLKGKVTTWDGLTGTWATAATYGDRIIAIYTQMLTWLTDRADL